MRLRRETGDFQIVVNADAGTVNSIRTGLSAEDLAGELVKVGSSYEPVSSATDGDGVVTFETKSYIFTYTKSTGAISAEANSGGGSDGGSGGGGSTEPLVIEGEYLYMDPPDAMVSEFSEPITTGLTVDDFVDAFIKLTDNSSGHVVVSPVVSATNNIEGVDYFGSGVVSDGTEITLRIQYPHTGGGYLSIIYIPSTGMIYDSNLVPAYEENLSVE